MDFIEMRISETELALEETLGGSFRIVRRYRREVLLREAMRGLTSGFVTVLALGILGGMMGTAWAIAIGVLAGCGWLLLAIVIVRAILAGGSMVEVMEL